MKKFGLLGHNISYSLSPIIHEAIYDYFGIEASYNLYSAEKSELGECVEFLKTIDGFNVTKPYKNDIIKYLHENNSDSSVNCVKVVDGKLIGYSTDGIGLIKAIKKFGIEITSTSNVVIIGAGGVASSICGAITPFAKAVYVCNRTLANAEKLASISGASVYDGQICDVVINCATTGGDKLLDNVKLSENAFAYDTNYNPLFTDFMAKAIFYNCKATNGLSMLVYQAIAAAKILYNVDTDCCELELYKLIEDKINSI